jgi:hypothetical protein
MDYLLYNYKLAKLNAARKETNIALQKRNECHKALYAFREVTRWVNADKIFKVFTKYPELIPLKCEKYKSGTPGNIDYFDYKDKLTGKEYKYNKEYKQYGICGKLHTYKLA